MEFVLGINIEDSSQKYEILINVTNKAESLGEFDIPELLKIANDDLVYYPSNVVFICEYTDHELDEVEDHDEIVDLIQDNAETLLENCLNVMIETDPAVLTANKNYLRIDCRE